MSSLLIRNARVVPLGANPRILENHTVLVQGSTIERILPDRDAQGLTASRKIDAGGHLLMPGFINAHMHFYSTFARGLASVKPSANFVEVLENLWWRLDRKLTLEDSYLSAMIPLIDAVRCGTTTLIDHHASPYAISGSLTEIARAVREVGLRASLCYEISDRDGAARSAEGVAENIAFAKRCSSEKSDSLRAMIGLHASFTVSDSTLEQAVAAARQNNIGLHVHTAEAASDQEACLKAHGKRVVERFAAMGVLGDKTICAHGVHLTPQELELLASTGTALVHNPQSNMNNAVGAANVLQAIEKGVLVGLGTDAMTVNMRAEMRTALWLQKHRQGNPSVAFCEIPALLLENNAKIAARQWPALGLGELKEGGAADMVLLEYHAPTPLSAENFLGHFVFGMAEARVRSTIAAGRVLMHNFNLELDVDEERITARSRELAAALWQRF
jgi:putative selenium metabolism protein SsnA